jgi:hypothetical protein
MLKTSNCYNVPALNAEDGPIASLEKSEPYKSVQLMPLSQAAITHYDGIVGQ